MRKLRIGVMAPAWRVPPLMYGGVEAVVDCLCRGLADAGHEVRLWVTTDSTCPVPRNGIVSSSRARSLGWSLPVDVSHAIEGYEWFAREAVDVVHDHSLVGPLIGPSRTSVPIVATSHVPFTTPEHDTFYGDVCERVAVVALTEDHAQGASKTRVTAVIPHGTDVHATPLGSGDGDDRGPFICFLGRMSADKGVREAALAARATGLRLVIAGSIHNPLEREYFETMVKPLLNDDVQYVGELDRDSKLGLLGTAAAFVNPIAWREPFGLTMIEALACGTPVLAFRRGSAPEIVEHGRTGALFDDLDDLIDGLGNISAYDRAACRRSAVERFSIERMVDDYVALFESMVEGGRSVRLHTTSLVDGP